VPGCEVARASGGVHRAWLAVRGRWSPGDIAESLLDRFTARTARLVICNSLRAAGEVVAWHGVEHARIRVVPTGTPVPEPDPERRSEVRRTWGVPPAGRVALFAAHGFGRKNLDAAVAGFARVGGPDDRLVVVGSDAHAARRLARAEALLGDRVVATGSAGSLDDALAGADALLHPTRYDAASNTVLEAMARGVPPVVSARDGAAERVPDRFLVVGDPEGVEGIGTALRYAWETPGLGAACTTAIRGWPESRMVSAVEQILEESSSGLRQESTNG
jgi:UDP-glucose:(heptosyl)LPS alpha-1,3-glucosyltransferase